MKDVMKRLRFSKSETKVIFFIAIVIAAGYIIRNTKQFFSELGKPYDYTGLDREFIDKSLSKTRSLTFSALEDSSDDESRYDARLIDSAGIAADSLSMKEEIFSGVTVNINTASKAELESLPGIGEAMAERIILYREDKGLFRKTEDIMKVKGIGKKKFEKLKNQITVN